MKPVLLVLVGSAQGRVRPSEREALWALYEATDGPNWLQNENWDLSKDPCRKHAAPVPHRTFKAEPFVPGAIFEPTPWYGVGCADPCDDYLDGEDCTAGRIISLRLRSVSKTPSMPASHARTPPTDHDDVCSRICRITSMAT